MKHVFLALRIVNLDRVLCWLNKVSTESQAVLMYFCLNFPGLLHACPYQFGTWTCCIYVTVISFGARLNGLWIHEDCPFKTWCGCFSQCCWLCLSLSWIVIRNNGRRYNVWIIAIIHHAILQKLSFNVCKKNRPSLILDIMPVNHHRDKDPEFRRPPLFGLHLVTLLAEGCQCYVIGYHTMQCICCISCYGRCRFCDCSYLKHPWPSYVQT